mgnify:CR=1 FL=1
MQQLPPVLMRRYEGPSDLMAVFTRPTPRSELSEGDFHYVGDDQRMMTALLRNAALRITPVPAARSDHVDVFGNLRSFFSLPAPHSSLHIEASSLVLTHPSTFEASQAAQLPNWEKVRDHFVYHAGAAWDAANNGWNQWVLGYNPQRQRDLLASLGF